ncbi:Rnf-Nqr [Synechococcus phage S-SSM5]|uniref:Rnf-Nqr n=1 Tax=Synechococcus phage S-SSM5 TaxID=445685 RepID=E3SKI2_9CAUD|nr:Rnf-Nqr [Synechococcus phage S-SSM5]ADO97928.1 Rnf-Nqr [Synechococcus phage S-SSM5]
MISRRCPTIRKAWRVWAKALGAKDGKTNREADTIAGIRTLIFVAYMVTNVAIVANAVRHWDSNKSVHPIDHCRSDVL